MTMTMILMLMMMMNALSLQCKSILWSLSLTSFLLLFQFCCGCCCRCRCWGLQVAFVNGVKRWRCGATATALLVRMRPSNREGQPLPSPASTSHLCTHLIHTNTRTHHTTQAAIWLKIAKLTASVSSSNKNHNNSVDEAEDNGNGNNNKNDNSSSRKMSWWPPTSATNKTAYLMRMMGSCKSGALQSPPCDYRPHTKRKSR